MRESNNRVPFPRKSSYFIRPASISTLRDTFRELLNAFMGYCFFLGPRQNVFTCIRQDDLPMHDVPFPVYPGLHVQL